MALFIYYVVLTVESVDKILSCGHSNETSSTILTYGTSCLVRSYNVTPGNEVVNDKAFQYSIPTVSYLLFFIFCIFVSFVVILLTWCRRNNKLKRVGALNWQTQRIKN